ncbi:MAG: LapA family protein [Actinobacteria bacterium]|nr:LapA family protein [Actinomycetota bacterium]
MTEEERPVRDVREMLEPEKRSTGLSPTAIIAIIALALLAVLVAQNTEEAVVTFLGFTQPLPLWLLSVILFLLGMIVGYALKARRERAKRRAAAVKAG